MNCKIFAWLDQVFFIETLLLYPLELLFHFRASSTRFTKYRWRKRHVLTWILVLSGTYLFGNNNGDQLLDNLLKASETGNIFGIGATESGPGKAVDCSQPPSPRRVSPDGILYEANKVEATPALTVLLQVRRTTPTSPDSQVPPAPPTAAPVETSPGRVLPLLSRLRQWTDHWKSVTIGKPSSKVSSRRISLSLSRLFNRPLGRPSRPAVPAHRGKHLSISISFSGNLRGLSNCHH